jgi:hypothetical protein
MERNCPMTPKEKQLYHQIHPLKLLTDISAEIASLYLFWQHKLVAGLVLGILPSVIVSAIMIKWADLEKYKQSAVGRYLKVNMTPFAVTLRILGTIISHIGAWYQPWLIPLGEVTVVLGWTLGLLRRKKTRESGKDFETPVQA